MAKFIDLPFVFSLFPLLFSSRKSALFFPALREVQTDCRFWSIFFPGLANR